MQTSIIITSTDTSGTKKQHSVTNIDPNATNAELGEFAQKFNSLSTNTYVETSRVDKMNVNEPSPSPMPSKTEPTLEISFTTQTSGTYEYNGDGVVYGRAFINLDSTVSNVFIKVESGTFALSYEGEFDELVVQLYASEGTNYAAKAAERQLS